ncbi:MAG: hypothetical protein N0C84_01130 [Candidatus Thiodiazotropha taylori]|uniref:Chitin-binding type-3 domain-containing protein n=1 Tax=Candidatus Thiodiazotropha taylori TaxID=2792791 RepID=A0A9E4KAV0_9GAMM|nr:hypothetical protein [Candidatus Thiodiazotropha taylori]MCW4255049.1 hypothetical protein [Candidatus Thiodiazotropha taylori]
MADIDYSGDNKGTMRKLSNISELFTYNKIGYPIAPFPWEATTTSLQWELDKEYAAGDFVSNNNKLYYALQAHTAAAADEPTDTNAGADTFWEEYIAGETNLDWKSGNDYTTNQFVSHDGQLYTAKRDISNSPQNPKDATDDFAKFIPDEVPDELPWRAEDTYDNGQFVSYNGKLYSMVLSAPHQSSVNPAQDTVSWKLYAVTDSDLSYQAIKWQNGFPYQKGDIVYFTGTSGQSKFYYLKPTAEYNEASNGSGNPLDFDRFASSKAPPTDTDSWQEMFEDSNLVKPIVQWDSTKGDGYDTNDFVHFGGTIYKNVTGQSSATEPKDDTTNWEEYAGGATGANLAWSKDETYEEGQFVSDSDKLYYAKAGVGPSTLQPKLDTANWQLYPDEFKPDLSADSEMCYLGLETSVTAQVTAGNTFNINTTPYNADTYRIAVYHSGIRVPLSETFTGTTAKIHGPLDVDEVITYDLFRFK